MPSKNEPKKPKTINFRDEMYFIYADEYRFILKEYGSNITALAKFLECTPRTVHYFLQTRAFIKMRYVRGLILFVGERVYPSLYNAMIKEVREPKQRVSEEIKARRDAYMTKHSTEQVNAMLDVPVTDTADDSDSDNPTSFITT